MDPISRAAGKFLQEADALWRVRPGRVLALVADASERADVAKALRLAELAPENKRPLFLYQAPFTDPKPYFDGLTDTIRADYEAIRRGACEEGVALPELSVRPIALGPVARAALAMERAATLLGERFDGVTVALLPEQVARGPAWRESVRLLDTMARSSRVRLAVHAPRGGLLDGMLLDPGARFMVDDGEVLDFLQDFRGESSGPRVTAEAEPLGATMGRRLRALLLEATRRLAAEEPMGAAAAYEKARELCAAASLVLEEAALLVGLGGIYLTASKADLAIERYSKAAGLAEAEGQWQTTCQAWLGVGGVHFLRGCFAPAATAYIAAADAARRGGVAALRAQALRMAATSFTRCEQDDAAARVLRGAEDLQAEAMVSMPSRPEGGG
jgi:hypothetical protein